MAQVNPDKIKRGWCFRCKQTSWPAEGVATFTCNRCGERLRTEQELEPRLRKVFRFQSWNDDVWLRGLGGTTPSGAALELGCHRTMIIKLCIMGVLERSVYDKDGFYAAYISDRSIQKALENKKTTGKWTGAGELSYRGYWEGLKREWEK